MTSLNFDTQTIVLILATLLTGLIAGLCFTWNNAVTPGIGQLADMGYLRSFQEMNRAIINPIFLIVFFGPFFLHIANIFLFKTSSGTILWLVMVSAAMYIIGLVAVTIFGNVPLNELLDKTDLMQASAEELKLAETLVASMNKKLKEIELKDRYGDALREVINAKITAAKLLL